METCILIPREFSIVLKAFASPPSPEHTPKKGGFPAGLLARAAVESLRSPHWDFNRNRPRLNTIPKKTERNGTPTTTETATTTIPSPASSPEPSSDGDQPLTPRPRHQVLRPIPIYSPLEMGATVWANVTLYPGQVFYPDQGEIRLDHLEIYNILPRYDVSTFYSLIWSHGMVVLHCLALINSLTLFYSQYVTYRSHLDQYQIYDILFYEKRGN